MSLLSIVLALVAPALGVGLLVLVWRARQWLREEKRSPGPWLLMARHLMRRRSHRVGLWAILFFAELACFADVLSSDLPLLLYKDGSLEVLPNLFRPRGGVINNERIRRGGLEPGDWAIFPPIAYGPLDDMGVTQSRRLEPPSSRHWLGTDDRGRDVMARMLHGARATLLVGVLSIGVAVLLGVLLGAVSGYLEGVWDVVIEYIVTLLLSFPPLFLLLAFQALLPPRQGMGSVIQLALIIGFTGWPGVSRLVRTEVRRARALDYVVAAQVGGLTRTRILLKHILPNCLGPVLVSATFGIAGAILTEGALSFLGFGVRAPTASWGEILAQARETRRLWMLLSPGLAIFMMVMAYNVLGEGLRDALDPRLRSENR